MTDLILTEREIFGLLESEDKFPIEFDKAWQWIEYSRKDNASRALKSNFQKGVDFTSVEWKTPTGGRPSTIYFLSLDCFEEFCLMAETEKGRAVRKHFIQCRRKYFELLKAESKTSHSFSAALEATNITAQILVDAGVQVALAKSWQLSRLAKINPAQAETYEEGKRLLAPQLTVEEIPVAPRQIGVLLAEKLGLEKPVTSIRINEMLRDLKLQVQVITTKPSGKTEKTWQLTEVGKDYGELVTDTARGHGKTVFNVRWFPKKTVDIIAKSAS